MLNNSQQMRLKLLQKQQFKKQQKQLVISLVIKLLTVSQMVKKNSQQNNLEKITNQNEKYLNKDICVQRKDKKILIILLLIEMYNINKITRSLNILRF